VKDLEKTVQRQWNESVFGAANISAFWYDDKQQNYWGGSRLPCRPVCYAYATSTWWHSEDERFVDKCICAFDLNNNIIRKTFLYVFWFFCGVKMYAFVICNSCKSTLHHQQKCLFMFTSFKCMYKHALLLFVMQTRLKQMNRNKCNCHLKRMRKTFLNILQCFCVTSTFDR